MLPLGFWDPNAKLKARPCMEDLPVEQSELRDIDFDLLEHNSLAANSSTTPQGKVGPINKTNRRA